MTIILTRTVPAAVDDRVITPFRIIVPRQLEIDDAMAVYKALREHENIKLQDPFFLPDVSSVYPGVYYGQQAWATFTVNDEHVFNLDQVASILAVLDVDYLEDTFVELDVPESLEDVAEALDVQDLSGTGQ